MNPRWTTISAMIAAGILPTLGLVDAILAWVGGNDATFSAILLRLRANYPLVAKGIAYGFGLFFAHVFMPTPDPRVPSGIELIARLFFAIGPVGYCIVMIAFGEGGHPREEIYPLPAQLQFAAESLIWLLAGGAIGRVWFPQHPFAWGLPK